MKKFLFSALACVAFAGSGFASNEIVELKISTDSELGKHYKPLEMMPLADYPCKFSLCVYDPETGEDIYGFDYSGTAGGADDCFNKGLRLQEELSIQYPGMNISMEIME